MGEAPEHGGPDRVQVALGIGLALVLVASIAARGVLGRRADPALRSPAGARSELADRPEEAERRTPSGPTAIERALPWVSEAAAAGLIGLVLGMVSRRLALLALALVLAAVGIERFLAWKGLVEVDWRALADRLGESVLNRGEGRRAAELAARHAPSAAALGLGWIAGFVRR